MKILQLWNLSLFVKRNEVVVNVQSSELLNCEP